jgi:hypothetical protein
LITALEAEFDVTISNTVIVNNLYAEYGRIANLTVSELNTGWKKITNYLASDTSDIGYTRDYEQYKLWITASTDGSATQQQEDRDGNLLYWLDETHTGMTTTANAFPVLTYVYVDLVKAEFSFREVEGVIRPRIILGAGHENPTYPERGKFFIDKDTDGGVLEYITSSGESRVIKLGEAGISITPYALEAISFNSGGFSVTYSGETMVWTWTKDGTGKITSLTNEDGTVPVTWG